MFRGAVRSSCGCCKISAVGLGCCSEKDDRSGMNAVDDDALLIVGCSMTTVSGVASEVKDFGSG